MTNTYIINDQMLRQYTGLNNNVDTKLTGNAIREAQDIHLQRIIGSKLYYSILNMIDLAYPLTPPTPPDEPIPIAEPYLTLINDYITDFLIYAAYYESLEYVFMRERNNGLLTPNPGEGGTSVDFSVYNSKRDSVRGKMEYYGERLSNYIAEKMSDFPELGESTELQEQLPDYGSQYKAPIIFKDSIRTNIKKLGVQTYNSKYPFLPQ